MTVANTYSDIRSLMIFIAENGIKDYEIFDGATDTTDISSIKIIGHNFSFDMYVSKDKITFSEFGFSQIPRTCFDLNNIEEIIFEGNVITIKMKKGNPFYIDFDKLDTVKSLVC